MEGVRWIVEPMACEVGRRREEERRVAYRLLCRLVGGEPRLAHDEWGRPYLPDMPEWSVSISHCRKAVAVAVSGSKRVGVDVECRRRVDEGLMGRVCTESELLSVRADADMAMAFLRLWTRKEAVLKCRGTGIRGFASLREALVDSGMSVETVECGIPDVVVSLATM